MKYVDFTRRYCNAKPTRFGWDVKGVSNADELHACLKKVMVRRLKSDVLHDLPPKQRSMVPVDVSTDKEKECRDIIHQLNTVRQSLAEILDEACSDEEANAARFESRSLLMQAYRASGIAKAPATTDYIIDCLDGSGTQKLVVFAHHKDVLDYIETAISAKYKGKLGMTRLLLGCIISLINTILTES
jgi:SWI/SNF-related matrix-associated actin-dependent regulator 1 of chromatin subfamily A